MFEITIKDVIYIMKVKVIFIEKHVLKAHQYEYSFSNTTNTNEIHTMQYNFFHKYLKFHCPLKTEVSGYWLEYSWKILLDTYTYTRTRR